MITIIHSILYKNGSLTKNTLFLNLKIHFEPLAYFEDCYIKRAYFELICPTTPNELKALTEKIPELFQ
jgi:hypothetical protein